MFNHRCTRGRERSYAARSVLLNKWSDSGTCWRSGHMTHLSWSAAFIRGSAQTHSWLLTHFLSVVWLLLWIQMIFKSSHFYSICLSFLSCLKGRRGSVLVFDGLIPVCGSKPAWNTAAAGNKPHDVINPI